jgi:hypothetical protein
MKYPFYHPPRFYPYIQPLMKTPTWSHQRRQYHNDNYLPYRVSYAETLV